MWPGQIRERTHGLRKGKNSPWERKRCNFLRFTIGVGFCEKKNQSTEERQCYSTSMPWLKRYECETEGNTKSECRLLLLFLTKGQEYLISSLLFGFFYTASNTSRSILLSASRIPLAQPSSSRRASKSRAWGCIKDWLIECKLCCEIYF
jgi:hypothetical protein